MKYKFKDKPRKFVVGVDQDMNFLILEKFFWSLMNKLHLMTLMEMSMMFAKKTGDIMRSIIEWKLQSFNFFSALVMNKTAQKIHHACSS